MVGIISCGTYIPRYRLTRQTISAAMGWLNRFGAKGEKAITNYDEDSLSMVVNAGMDCIAAVDRAAIDGLYFAGDTVSSRSLAGLNCAADSAGICVDAIIERGGS